ncbi:hypothetical protein CASFOL_031054 [Castilleja foliolosa]|uniref:Uncharacterized protein n=1 Tax=Castilleja foliolosa TaxID=1961234 RepID=A0ABD3C5I6_9LAMI
MSKLVRTIYTSIVCLTGRDICVKAGVSGGGRAGGGGGDGGNVRGLECGETLSKGWITLGDDVGGEMALPSSVSLAATCVCVVLGDVGVEGDDNGGVLVEVVKVAMGGFGGEAVVVGGGGETGDLGGGDDTADLGVAGDDGETGDGGATGGGGGGGTIT